MTKDQLRAAVGGRAENLDLLQQSTGVKAPDPAAEAGLELGPHHRQRSGGLRLEQHVHLRTERLCYDVRIRCLPHAFPSIFNAARCLFLCVCHSFARPPAREPPSVPLQPHSERLRVHSPHLARPRSGPNHLLQLQRRPDRRKQNHTIKGINRRSLPTALGPPPGLPLPGRSPRNTPPHGVQRAAEASELLAAGALGLRNRPLRAPGSTPL